MARSKHSTVLFIDDEKPWLDAVQLSTKDASFNVMTATSGEAALQKLHRKKPDLIVSDVRMPFMNGFDLYEKIRTDPKLRSVPYVFMSSLDDFDAKRTAKELGADGYIDKPFSSDEITTIVSNLLTQFKR